MTERDIITKVRTHIMSKFSPMVWIKIPDFPISKNNTIDNNIEDSNIRFNPVKKIDVVYMRNSIGGVIEFKKSDNKSCIKNIMKLLRKEQVETLMASMMSKCGSFIIIGHGDKDIYCFPYKDVLLLDGLIDFTKCENYCIKKDRKWFDSKIEMLFNTEQFGPPII